jgi:hypothetical protein
VGGSFFLPIFRESYVCAGTETQIDFKMTLFIDGKVGNLDSGLKHLAQKCSQFEVFGTQMFKLRGTDYSLNLIYRTPGILYLG